MSNQNTELSDWVDLGRLCLEMTNHTDDFRVAFEQWQNERQTLAELHDENQAMEIISRRMVVMVELARQVVEMVEKDAAMFITPDTRLKIEKFAAQCVVYEKDKFQLRVIANQIRA